MTDIDKAETPAPCPFCGGEAEWKRGFPGYAWISCKSCPAETSEGSIPHILEAWNRRAALPARGVGVKPHDVLAGLSSYLGAGLGDDDTTPEQYDKRIRWGVDHQIAVTVQRCADVIEELSKEAYSGKRVPWGQIKQAVLAVSPALAPTDAAQAPFRIEDMTLADLMRDPLYEEATTPATDSAQAREAALDAIKLGFLSAAPGEWRVSDIERVTEAILRAMEGR